ncbi:unnamed protein product [Clonostachys rosea]|uniref:BZIP domain-containing protein n=1 Tax=Bionectria ochroleuca TaxID=29856 RepID=A0ABY6U5G8_BIOOC|nr:unnamed protein product [Clonostachys rosea]
MKPSTDETASSDEETGLTPIEFRKIVEARSAQRANKKQYVKDLEAKIAALRASQKETEEEKKKLQQDLAKAYTENANLRFAPPSPKSEC